MKRISVSLLMAGVICLISFCTKKGKGEEAQGGGSNMVSGMVTDASGNPVAGARIRAENPTGNNIHINATSSADGRYSMQLTAIGGWTIYAWKEVEFEGSTYQVRLGMEKDADYDAFTPGKPLVRNFVWKLSGRIPDRPASKENGTGYFGGTVKFINYNSLVDIMPPGTEVTILFTPVEGAKFLDGTSAAGKTVTRSFTIKDGVGQAYYVNDVPATKYVITASSRYNGADRETYLGGGNPDEFFQGFEYMFPSEGGSGSKENGLGSPNEYAFYILHQ